MLAEKWAGAAGAGEGWGEALGCSWTHPHLGSHVSSQQLFFPLISCRR